MRLNTRVYAAGILLALSGVSAAKPASGDVCPGCGWSTPGPT